MAFRFPFRGIVRELSDLEHVGKNATPKLTVVLSDPSAKSGNNIIPITFLGDDISKADEIQIGAEVEIEAWINGREWQKDANSSKKFFVDLSGNSVTILSKPQMAMSGRAESF